MALNQSLLQELENEGQLTRKMLLAIPLEHPEWKPHEKSMTIQRLASHVAELPWWVSMTIDVDVLDFAKFDYKPFLPVSNEELLKYYDEKLAKAKEDLGNASDETLLSNWTMRNGETIYFTMPKLAVIRTWSFNHLIHHRGQLSVYLRLMDIPVPGMYGPTADEK